MFHVKHNSRSNQQNYFTMIFKILKATTEFIKIEFGTNRFTEYHDRLLRFHSLTFLRTIRDTEEEKATEILKYTMLPFILLVGISYELVWRFILPDDNTVRLVLIAYLLFGALCLYSTETFLLIYKRCVQFLGFSILSIWYLSWLFSEHEQTEDDIMIEGYQHVGPPYPSPLHVPGYFEHILLVILCLVILLLFLVSANYLMGRFVVNRAKWFAGRSLKMENPDQYFQTYLDYMIFVPCLLISIIAKYQH
jgi:hypothetical protein